MKNRILFSLRLLVCAAALWGVLFLHIDRNNALTELRREIPLLEKEVRALHEDNVRLQYEIDQFENPLHLMELARKPEFTHLTYHYQNHIIILSTSPCGH